ncbi:MAG: TraB/GumN family protein [Rhodanobacteraceae bacterium]
MFRFFAAVILIPACAVALAQLPQDAPVHAPRVITRSATTSSITTLQAVNVTGVVPGPGLWKVSRGDHVLWILGVVPTLPAGIEWRSAQVAQAIAGSQTVLEPPGVKLKIDTNWFGKLFLLLPVYHAQRNQNGKTLLDVLPPAMYARWEASKRRYFGNDQGIERYKPIIVAIKLFKEALKKNGMHGDGEIDDTVAALAKQHGVRLMKPETTLEIREPRQAVKAFAASGPDGIACLGLVLDVVEHQLPDFRARANAWATGDIATLRRIPESAYRETCKSAITGAGFAKSLGIDNLPARIESKWLGAADTALATDTQSFAVLPMNELLDPHGYLAALQAHGDSVTAPNAGNGNADEPAAASTVMHGPADSVP